MASTHKSIAAVAIVGLALSLGACINPKKPDNTASRGTMTIMCDNSFENILEQEIDVFEFTYPEAHVLANYVPENVAVDSLLTLTTKSIIIPRDLSKAERKRIADKGRHVRGLPIAVDAIALIVNNDNPLNDISREELQMILSGEINTWDQLGPGFSNDSIAVLCDSSGSSMASFMRDSLNSGNPLHNVYAQGSIQAVSDAVKKNKSAIGLIGVSWLTIDLKTIDTPLKDRVAELEDDTEVVQMDDLNTNMLQSGVKVLGVMGHDDRRAYRPFQQNIYDGSYPLTRRIYMFTVAPTGSLGGGFYSFMTGHIGQKIIMKTGILPARVPINIVELTN